MDLVGKVFVDFLIPKKIPAVKINKVFEHQD